MTTATRSGLTTGLCVDEAEFASLAGPWRRLYERCEEATPFQSHAWLTSWWRSYGRPGRLRVLLVRDGGDLVAAAPLMRTYRPVPALRPIGGAISDFADVLLAADGRERAADALTEGLRGLARGTLIDFREARPGACVESVYERWRGPRRELTDSPCLELPPLPVDALLKRLPTATAQRARAKLRKLTAVGVRARVVPADEVETSVATLLRLHQLQWQGRRVTTEHLRPRFREHLLRSVRPMVAAGDAVVTEFSVDGEVLAADVTLLSARVAGGYLYGAHPRLRERKVDVATMLLDASTRHTAGDRPRTLSLLRGDEPYKHHWRPDPAPNRRFLLAHARTAPLLAAAAGEAAARDWARGVRRERRLRQQRRADASRGREGRPGGGTSP
ncbi:GNAT family N-acetyltransferase [Streptomyces alboflavus]|uniref:GNAT family N-acetyltransferase n=1 Tax=Streptomyces alboflavus TaxID=67267 RepID=UPI0004C199B7|nr:GNAT family N-acetyltransferase [Streptomyces alboflavus]